jgi:tRNA A-37 threonylcarbamoyl transferase component Bud32
MPDGDLTAWIQARLVEGERLLVDDLAAGPRYYFYEMQESQYAHEFFARVGKWRRWHSSFITGLRRRLRHADHLIDDALARFTVVRLLRFRIRDFNHYQQFADVDLSDRARYVDSAGWLELRMLFQTAREQEPSWTIARETMLRELRDFVGMVLEQVPDLEIITQVASPPTATNADDDRFGPFAAAGGGAYGDVWRAHNKKLQREVAIKFIRSTDAATSLVWQHGRAVARVPHQNIVTIYDVMNVRDPETGETAPAIVMEWIDGESLAACLRRVVDIRDAYRIGHGIVDAVAAIHAEALAHFDLHDENVIVRRDVVKVIDLFFGVSAMTATAIQAGQRGRDLRSVSSILTSLLIAAQIDLDRVAEFQRQALAADATLERLRAAFDEALAQASAPAPPARPPLDDLGRRLLLHVAAVGDSDDRGRRFVLVADLAKTLEATRPALDDEVRLASELGYLTTHRMGKYVELDDPRSSARARARRRPSVPRRRCQPADDVALGVRRG